MTNLDPYLQSIVTLHTVPLTHERIEAICHDNFCSPGEYFRTYRDSRRYQPETLARWLQMSLDELAQQLEA